jgi:dihydropyrimidinase
MHQLLIKNGLFVNSDSSFRGDLAVSNSQIVQIAESLDVKADKVIDAGGRLVIPGVIDTHVHLPWPSSSFDSVDDFKSGTTAAACGGVTTIIEYIVPDESGRIIPALEAQLENAKKNAFVDYSFHLIIRKVTQQTLEDMAEAVKRGFTSFKIYTAYAGFRLEDHDVLTLLLTAKKLGAIVCFHAEDGVLVNFAIEQLSAAGQTDMKYYPLAHPRLADIEATHRVIAYANQVNARIHIVHVNTKEGARLIGQARRDGLRITGETCPQYLMFTEDVYKSGKPEAAYFVLSPVIRAEEDRQMLWNAIVTDELQTVATDHCPYTREQKLAAKGDFRYVPGGAAGIETSMPLLYTHGVVNGKLSLQRMVALTSKNPAQIFNLYPRKGVIAVGSDADFVIYDQNEAKSKVDYKKLHSKFDHTIYEGLEVSGKHVATILRGEVIAENGDLVSKKPSGMQLTRQPYAD